MPEGLRKAKDFERVYRRGRTTRVNTLLFRSILNNLDTSRIGVVVSRKVAKSSVRRNRLRRQVREFWEKLGERKRPGLDIIVTVIKDQESSPAELEQAFKRAGLLN
jgi:ribonuclease P protein component